MSQNLAAKLRSQADAMQKTIDAKLDPAIGRQRVTRRRADIAAGMRREGYALQSQQNALRALADLHECGECPAVLAHITKRTQVEQIFNRPEWPTWEEGQKRMIAAGFNRETYEQERELLTSLLTPESPEQAARRKLQAIERDLIGVKIPGFFPTPEQVVRRMLQEAELESGMTVLEPSAGIGDIVVAALDAGALVDYVEINLKLIQILGLKAVGGKCSGKQMDFLEITPPTLEGHKYDRVLMNPPFENGQDAEHVRHAYEFLKDGGRLVAIMGEGTFYRSDAKARGFMQWLYDVGGFCYKLPEGSFYSSFRPTGVNTRLVVIDKVPLLDPDGSGGEPGSCGDGRERVMWEVHTPGDGCKASMWDDVEKAIMAHVDDLAHIIGTSAAAIYESAYKERDGDDFKPWQVLPEHRVLQARRAVREDFKAVMNDLEAVNYHSVAQVLYDLWYEPIEPTPTDSDTKPDLSASVEQAMREAWAASELRAAQSEYSEWKQNFKADLNARGLDICDWLDEQDIPHHSAQAERYAHMVGCGDTFSENKSRRQQERRKRVQRGGMLARQTQLLQAQQFQRAA